jgi:ELWxxDGT repeat protein
MKKLIVLSTVLALACGIGVFIISCGGGGGGGDASIEGKFFFSADNGVNGLEPWSYDGTGSPIMVENLLADPPAGDPESSEPSYFKEYNGLVYFKANDSDGNGSLWATDGSSAWMVTVRLGLADPAILDGKLYYRGHNGSRNGLWVFDGVDLTELSSTDIFYSYMTPSDGKIIMSGYSPGESSINAEPFVSDGVNITKIQDIGSPFGSYPMYFTELDGSIYFRATDDGTDYELWATDGSSAWMVTPEINAAGSANPSYLAAYDGLLYFSATDGTNGRELWASDGSSSWMVTPEIHTSGEAAPNYLTVCNAKLYFAAYAGTDGKELWEYDSALDQLQMAANINTAAGVGSDPTGVPDYPNKFICMDNNLYFGAEVGSQGYELYVYDGSTAELAGGTEMNPTDDFWFMGF